LDAEQRGWILQSRNSSAFAKHRRVFAPMEIAQIFPFIDVSAEQNTGAIERTQVRPRFQNDSKPTERPK
jgi:hypothetical protein